MQSRADTTPALARLEVLVGEWSALDFAQRFVGTIAEDANRIEAMWQTASDGEHWEKDFDIVYTKIG